MRPYVGIPRVDRAATCGFSGDLDLPECSETATLHLIVDSAAWGLVCLPSCGAHAVVARSTGPVMSEHDVTWSGCRCG